MSAFLLAALLQAAPADAPVVKHFADGTYRLDEASWAKLDAEVKRLQKVEQEHLAEPAVQSQPTPIIGTAAVVVIVVGIVAAVVTPVVLEKVIR